MPFNIVGNAGDRAYIKRLSTGNAFSGDAVENGEQAAMMLAIKIGHGGCNA